MLNFIAPLNYTSYGYTGCYLLRELQQLCKVACLPISNVMVEPKFEKVAESALQTPFYHNAPSVKLWHQHSLHGFVGRGSKFGYTIFELPEFNEREIHSVTYPDHMITCSEWGRQIIIDQAGRDPNTVHVVPLGIDPAVFKPVDGQNTQKTVFLNAGKWEYRKGHDILAEAFNDAFKPSDNVELWMLPHNFFLSDSETAEWVKYYKNTKLGDKIEILNRLPTHDHIYDVMRRADCGVFPSRAEGWNLELLEMMSIGKHVIATDCTGHTEFANSDNCHLIDVDKKEVAIDGKFFDGHGSWSALEQQQIDQLVEHMRVIHDKRKHGELEKNRSGIETGKEYTWENAAKKLLGVVNDNNEQR